MPADSRIGSGEPGSTLSSNNGLRTGVEGQVVATEAEMDGVTEEEGEEAKEVAPDELFECGPSMARAADEAQSNLSPSISPYSLLLTAASYCDCPSAHCCSLLNAYSFSASLMRHASSSNS